MLTEATAPVCLEAPTGAREAHQGVIFQNPGFRFPQSIVSKLVFKLLRNLLFRRYCSLEWFLRDARARRGALVKSRESHGVAKLSCCQ